MGKNKKGGKRMSKKQMVELLENFFSSEPGQTFTLKEIFQDLKLNTHPLKMLAIDTMDNLSYDDYLTKVNDSSYKLNQNGQVQEGTFVRKANGKNSFIPDGGEEPVFVSERNSLFAMGGDRVKVSIMARRPNRIKEAQVLEILKRAKETFVGKLKVGKDLSYLVTPQTIFTNDIIIPKRKLKEGRSNDKAIVKITQWPDANHKNPIGEVLDVLGPAGNNNVEMNSILAQYGLPYIYPKAVEQAADKISGDILPQDLKEREDYRNVWTCTIDPKDAKDFDDALSFRKIEDGLYEVGVHIADVSHFVKEGDIIDREARKRSTSVYLVDRTIPMLPERLCNFLCSLRPDEEKFTYSAIFELDDEANIRKFHIAHTLIKSNRRYCYEEVQQLLEDNGIIDGTGQPAPSAPAGGYKGQYAEQLITLDRLAKKLRAKRFREGSVKFDTEELHFDVDATGKPIRCYYKHSKDANKLVEEFMLLANRSVAESVGKVPRGKKAKTFPYRIHDNPDPTKFETLKDFVVKFGYRMKSSSTKGATARSLNRLMDDVEDKPEGKLIQTIALRAMMKAKYSVHNIGHFGLGFEYYTHFTSPIRRYPDVMVHRLLTRYANGGRSANEKHYEDLCEHCSDMEIIAQNAERDSIKYKMVEFMGEHLGEKYDARISGITSYGIYAEINENHCEGMVPMRDLDDDYYDFDEKNFCLIGRHHHHKYQLGDPVRIQVAQANLEKKQLDFLLLNDQTSPDGKATRTEKTQADKKSGKNRKKHNDEREKKKKGKHVRK
ncbi:MAG: ribonuclease R [Prevotella sp.]|jgi:ribonuclease R|nr:ribonuclease R [Prevotella sp.]MCI1685874.1 ribonuclease R [Prevotella sp.]MCI1781384.1 ribonuclease R [Prevotella sp.]MCI1802302.1 ribonuclease R [Prevotella sp.]MCI1816100.1 ribonuclease R [Prevotella sp.]MCI1847729.1 ribonuclease R [Prevotella sp.]